MVNTRSQGSATGGGAERRRADDEDTGSLSFEEVASQVSIQEDIEDRVAAEAAERLRKAKRDLQRTQDELEADRIIATQIRTAAARNYYREELEKGNTRPDMSAWADVWKDETTTPQVRASEAPTAHLTRKSAMDIKLSVQFSGKDQQNLQAFIYHLNTARAANDWTDIDWVLCAQNNMTVEMTYEWTTYVGDKGGDVRQVTVEECKGWMTNLICPQGLRAVMPVKELLKDYYSLASKPPQEIWERVNRARIEASDKDSTNESLWVVLAYLACPETLQAHLMSGFDKMPETMQELARRLTAVKHLAKPSSVEAPRTRGESG